MLARALGSPVQGNLRHQALGDEDMFCAEMEVEEAKAERVLREHNGEAVAALRFLVNSA